MVNEKVILITGAGSGLGKATAKLAAKKGATVIANDLGTNPDGKGTDKGRVQSTVDDIKSSGGKAMASFGDVTDQDYIRSLVEETVEEYGQVDGVINYAGFLRDSMSFNMSEEDWDAVLDVHLKGHFNLLHVLGERWRGLYKEDKLGSQRSFLAVSSASSRGNAGQINYSAAKAGVLGLTRTGARDLEQYNVRVNALMPAALTPLLKDGIPDDILADVPEDEAGPARVAPLPITLMSDEAEDITGWTFGIGGNTLYSVTDPEFERFAINKGGWTTEELPEAIDQLFTDRPRSKTEPGGLLGRVLNTL